MCAKVLVKNVGLCESKEELSDLSVIDGAFQRPAKHRDPFHPRRATTLKDPAQ